MPSDEPPRLYAGQPISALLTIQTSFHWGSNTNDVQYVMQFDVEEMVREWLVSGKKRGHFVAKAGFRPVDLSNFELTFCKGRLYIQHPNHPDCSTPWRAGSPQGHGVGCTINRGTYNGIDGYSEH